MDRYRMIDGKDSLDFVSGFTSFLKKIAWFVVDATRTYFKTAIVIFFLTAGCGFFFWNRCKAFYEAVMVCTFKEMNKKTYGEMVHNLDILAKSHSYSALAAQLNIPVQAAQNIVSIDGKNMAGSMLYEDINPDRTPMYFDVKAAQIAVFPIMETALVNYLNMGSAFMNAKLRNDSADISAGITYLTKNLSIVDSDIATVCTYFKKAPFTDTSITASKFAALIRYEGDLEEQLIVAKRKATELKPQVEVLHGFLPPDQPISNRDKILWLTIAASVILPCAGAAMRKALDNDPKLQSV